MPREGNPISVRLGLNRSSDSSWFSDYYYGKLVYQDINLRSYFGSIRPPTKLTYGFRLGRCIILHFPKRTFIDFFIPRRPRRMERRRGKSRPGNEKGRWWSFGDVGPIGCLTEERNEVIGRGAGEKVESIRLDDRKKQKEIRIWPEKKQHYGYHDRSPSIKNILSKSLRVSGAFKHPKYAGVGNDMAFLIENDESFRKSQLFKFFFQNQSRSDGPTSHLLKRTLPAVRPSFDYILMQYLLNTKNQMHFDPAVVLNHFVASGVTEPSAMGGANAQERNFEKRIRSRIAFFVESSTSEKKSLAEAKTRLTHFICQANDLRFAGTTKTTISLFPFFGATFFFLRDEIGVYNNPFFEDTREQLLGKLRRKCWNLLGQDKVMELIEKFIDLGGLGELTKGIEMMTDIILRNRRIPYGYNYYLNEVKKMRSLLSNRTNTNTSIESVKIKSDYQSASLIAQDISFQLRNRPRSFRSIFSQIVKDIPLEMKKGVEGIRISCSGRLGGAEIARTECGKYGKTSSSVFNRKIDYAFAKVSTRYGILGVKVWISYSQKGRKHCPQALESHLSSEGLYSDSDSRLACADSNQFHAVCLDTLPPIFSMNDTSHGIISCVEKGNCSEESPQVAYTFDAGPNAVLIARNRKAAASDYVIFPSPVELLQDAGVKRHERCGSFADKIPAQQYKGDVSYFICTRPGKGPVLLCDESKALLNPETGYPKQIKKANAISNVFRQPRFSVVFRECSK